MLTSNTLLLHSVTERGESFDKPFLVSLSVGLVVTGYMALAAQILMDTL